jgi:hypothetical protein
MVVLIYPEYMIYKSSYIHMTVGYKLIQMQNKNYNLFTIVFVHLTVYPYKLFWVFLLIPYALMEVEGEKYRYLQPTILHIYIICRYTRYVFEQLSHLPIPITKLKRRRRCLRWRIVTGIFSKIPYPTNPLEMYFFPDVLIHERNIAALKHSVHLLRKTLSMHRFYLWVPIGQGAPNRGECRSDMWPLYHRWLRYLHSKWHL